jgi:NAD(P)H-dependent FMN reductase
VKVVAVVGTYRRGRTIDTAVDEVLRGAQEAGAETEKIVLLDKHIEFCTNCRVCTQTPGIARGRCVLDDDMEEILDTLDKADAFILATPVNFYTVTAIMKRFIERLVCYGYWPWGTMPKNRIKKGRKKALLIASSACPAFIGRIAFRHIFSILKGAVRCLGAGPIHKLYLGTAAFRSEDSLSTKDKHRAYSAGKQCFH